MALHAGELMVIIRAQDFASRTLRRVSGEFAGMSRAQQMQMLGERVAASKASALSRVAMAESNMRRLNYVKNGVLMRDELQKQMAAMEAFRTTQAQVMTGGKFHKGFTAADRQAFQQASYAIRQMGLEGAVAADRLAKADAAARAAAKDLAAAQAAVPPPRTRGRAAALRRVTDAGVISATAQRELRNAQRAFDSLGEAGVRSATRFQRLSRQVANFDKRLGFLPTTLQRAAQNMRVMGDQTYRARAALQTAYADLDRATKAEMAFNRALAQMPAENLDRVAHAMSGLGRTMQLFGAVGVAAFGLAANAAANFQTDMSLAATQARDLNAPVAQVATRIDQLTNGVDKLGKHTGGTLDLLGQFPTTSDQLSKAAYDVFSSMDLENKGIINVTKGLGLLKDANKIAVAGGVDLAEGTDALITVLNNFDPQLQNTNKQFDTMFNIVRFGRLTIAQFNQMMTSLAPAAADAGLKLQDIGGAMAYLTTVMPSQQRVGTGLARLIELLRSRDAVEGLRKLGINAINATTGGLKPLDKLIGEIVSKFPKLATGQKGAEEFFRQLTSLGRGGGLGTEGTIQARRVFSELVRHMAEYQDIQTRVTNNAGEFQAAYTAQMKTLGVQWKIFLNQVKVIALEVGQQAIPVFIEFGKYVSKLLDWWKKLNPSLRESIVRIAVLSSIFTLLGGVALTVFGSLFAFEAMIRRLAISGGVASGSMGSLLMVLRRFAAIGAISLIFKAKVTGSTTAMELLQGGLAGMLIGSKYGKFGAIKGGILVATIQFVFATPNMDWFNRFGRALDEKIIGIGNKIPLIGKSLVQDFQKDLQGRNIRLQGFDADQILKKTHNQGEKMRAYGHYLAMNIRKGIREGLMTFKEFEAFLQRNKAINAVERNRVEVHTQAQKDAAAADKKAAAGANKNYKAQKDALDKWYAAMKNYKQQNQGFQRALKDWQNSLAQATKQGAQTALDNLQTMYTEIEQRNRTAFGELFSGKWLTSETFDLAKEWGIKPKINDLIKDLKSQLSDFYKWEQSLNKLIAAGAPQSLISELQKQGPGSQDMVDALLGGRQGRRKTEYMLKGWTDGLVKSGNIDIMNRKIAHVGKSIATVRSITVGFGKEFMLLPTIINGKALKGNAKQIADQAIAVYRKTGKNLGTFSSEAQANAYAVALHKQQAAVYKGGGSLLQEYFRLFKKREAMIKKQSRMDFTDEIQRFKKAGGDMGAAIIDGFQSAEVGLWFDKWVKKQFPAEINAAVNEAVKRFKESTPKPTPTAKAPGPKPPQPEKPKPSATTTKAASGGKAATYAGPGSTIQHQGDTYDVKVIVPPQLGGVAVARRIAWELKHSKHKTPASPRKPPTTYGIAEKG